MLACIHLRQGLPSDRSSCDGLSWRFSFTAGQDVDSKILPNELS